MRDNRSEPGLWLLIENRDIGGAVTGTAAIMMLFLQLTGIVLWAPAKLKSWKKWDSWKNGFSVKTDARFKRINFDLHKAMGFYAFMLVTIMAVTGPYFAFQWYKTGFASVLGTKPPNNRNQEVSVYPKEPKAPISIETIIQKVDSVYPYQGTIKINLPQDSTGSVAILKSKEGFFASAGVDRLTLDQYSGRALVVNKFSDKSLGEKIVASAKHIHDGEIFGTSSKILYFLACLIATSLPVTGFLIWLGRGKKEKSQRKHTAGVSRQRTG